MVGVRFSPERPRGLPLSRRLLPLLALLSVLLPLLAPPLVGAQSPGPDTRELRTTYFTIQYDPSDYRGAEWYAGVVDGVYDDVTELFGYRPATPISFRLTSSVAEYARENPLGINPGVLAHMNTRERELGVVSPRLAAAGGRLATDTIRHELTHLIVSELSNGRLTVGFHEGIAQYVEHDHPDRESLITVLQRAHDGGRLMSWQDLNDRDQFYGDIATGYAQAFAVATFLVERPDGFPMFRRFLTLLGQGQAWPAALERAYGRSVADLEAEWRAGLPQFLAGGWQNYGLRDWNPEPARQLLATGDYAGAAAALERSLALYESRGVTARVERIRPDLERARTGRDAAEAFATGETELADGNFPAAEAAYAAALRDYETVGDTNRATVARGRLDAARTGLAAATRLAEARAALSASDIFGAQRAAAAAAEGFALAGDPERQAEAEAILDAATGVRRWLGLAGLVAGAVLLTGFALWSRRLAGPARPRDLFPEQPGPAL